MPNQKFLTQKNPNKKQNTKHKKIIEIFSEAQTSKIFKEGVMHKVKSMSLSKDNQWSLICNQPPSPPMKPIVV